MAKRVAQCLFIKRILVKRSDSPLLGHKKPLQKITFVSVFYPFRGGIAHFANRLFSELKSTVQFQNINFSTLYPPFLFPGKTLFESKSRFREVPSQRLLSSVQPLSWWYVLRHIRKFLPDYVIFSYWSPWVALPYLFLAWRLKKENSIKIGVLIHNTQPHELLPLSCWILYRLLKYADIAIALSKNTKHLMQKWKIPHTTLFHPIYDQWGSPIEKSKARQKLQIAPNQKVVLFFGLIRHYKGLDLMLQAQAQLKEKKIYLIIAGESYENFEKYKSLIQEYELSNSLQMHLKFVPEDEVKYFFCAADVCVLPYRKASQSGVLSIAYYFELPVIVSQVGGLYESVETHKTGVVCQPTCKDIEKNIASFFESDCQGYIANIRKYKTQHNWQCFAEQIKKAMR